MGPPTQRLLSTRRSIAIAGLGLAVAAAAGVAVSLAIIAHHGRGPVLWVKRYNGPGHLGDEASSVAVSPDGDTVVVTGLSTGASGRKDYATIAYNAATGARLWLKRYGGPGPAQASPSQVAISPSGDRVFVTGRAPDPGDGPHPSRSDYVTVAYALSDGRQLWVSGLYSGPYQVQRSAVLAVSPDGRTVFVSGPTAAGYATAAYNAATGAQLWARLDRPATGFDSFFAATALAVSPDGRTLLAAWANQAGPRFRPPALTTVAFRAATGARLWVRSSGATTGMVGVVPAIAVNPRGRTVIVSGTCSLGRPRVDGYLTNAYDIASGARIWVGNYLGPGRSGGSVSGLAVSPAGSMAYVTGFSRGRYTTVAYRMATGAQAWVRRYSRGYGAPSAIAVGRSGRVYVTGSMGYYRYATVAYSAGGVQLWARRYHARGLEDSAQSLAVSPATGVVYITGYVGTNYERNFDYLTIAYRG